MIKNVHSGVRNPAIELYRILLMFGICLLHSITMCGHDNSRFPALLFPCVNGFVFISGWFGIKFSFKGLLKLVFNALYAGGMSVLLTWLFMPEQLSWSQDCLKTIRYIVIGQWFFLAYVALMLVAPAVNYVIDRMNRDLAKKVLIPFSVLLLWNWASDTPGLCKLSYPDGFGSYTPLALANTYVVARLIRRFDLFSFLTLRCATLAIALMTALFLSMPRLNFSAYASPVAIAFAAAFFYLFERIGNQHVLRWGWVINLLAPSMFTVYLLHAHKFGFVAMSRVENVLSANCCDIWICCIAAALFVFWVGVLADMPRRVIFKVLVVIKFKP